MHPIEDGESDLREERRKHVLAIQGEGNFLSDVVVPFVARFDDRNSHFVEHRPLSLFRLVEADSRLPFCTFQ